MESSRTCRKKNVRFYCQLPIAYRGTGLLVLFIILSIVSQTFAFQAEEIGQPDYAEAIKAFDEYVKKRIKVDQVPGLSIGFIKKDFMWARGYGYSDLENKVPARPESAFRLASITKTITASAVLQLMEAGKISLDAEVQAYVPYFPEKKWPVTIRLLLAQIAVSLFPENAGLHEDIGDLAVKYYQKALKLEPTQSRIKNKLKQLKKKSLRASKAMGQGEIHCLTKEL